LTINGNICLLSTNSFIGSVLWSHYLDM